MLLYNQRPCKKRPTHKWLINYVYKNIKYVDIVYYNHINVPDCIIIYILPNILLIFRYCDCLHKSQPSSHVQFYHVNGLWKSFTMSHRAKTFSNDNVMFVVQNPYIWAVYITFREFYEPLKSQIWNCELGWFSLGQLYFTDRLVPIIILKLPIMFWSNALDSCILIMLTLYSINHPCARNLTYYASGNYAKLLLA